MKELHNAPLYPDEKLRNQLERLGIPRYKHDLGRIGEFVPTHVYFHKAIYRGVIRWYGRRMKDDYQQKVSAETEADCKALAIIRYLV